MTPTDPQESENEDRVEALVFETLERMESEGSAAIERAASDHPELEHEFRTRLGALQAMGLVDFPEDLPNDLPETVGPFQLGKPLGEGGMGLVFEAHDPGINRTVAIKLIRPQYMARESLRERFAREGQAIARLQHPSVARVFQVGEESGLPFIAMERIVGCTVAEVLDTVLRLTKTNSVAALTGQDFLRTVQQLSDDEDLENSPTNVAHGLAHRNELFDGSWAEVAIKICREVAEGLAHAHSAGVLHRDVKASNIMVTPSGRVLLIDFGLAQLDTAATMTATGSRLGSLPYTAPERIEPGTTLTPLADVYALGVVLYEMLALRLPFVAGSEAGLTRLIAQGNPQPIARVHPGIRPVFAEVCERAMRMDPARRPPTAAALARDLSRVLTGKAPIAYGDGLFAALGSRWRAQPKITASILAATLLAISLPTAVLSMRANAAERVAESEAVSLRRLQLTLQATASLQDTLPDSPAIQGTPLETLRKDVLRDLAGIEARVLIGEIGTTRPSSTLQAADSKSKPKSPDRVLIDRARALVKHGLGSKQGHTSDLFAAQQAAALVNELKSIREQTSRSVDVDAALIELTQALALHAKSVDDPESAVRWRDQAMKMCDELRRTLPESTWLAAKRAELIELSEGQTQ